MCDVGVQCNLSGEELVHANDSESDELFDDEEFMISDTSSTSDESYYNEEMKERVLENNAK